MMALGLLLILSVLYLPGGLASLRGRHLRGLVARDCARGGASGATSGAARRRGDEARDKQREREGRLV